jgi:hypothetical protein
VPFLASITIGPDGVSPDALPAPVPLNVTGGKVFVALLVTDSVPAAEPAAVGVNDKVTGRLEVGLIVAGSVTPLYANGPDTEIPLTVTLAELLLLVSVTVCLLLAVPTVSLPKLKEVGLSVSCPAWGAPVPLRAIAVGEVAALLTNDKLPVTLPDAVGAKLTVMVPDPPAATFMGRETPMVPNPEPVMFMAVTERDALPVFEMVNDCFPVLPTLTLPNAKLPGSTEICGCI